MTPQLITKNSNTHIQNAAEIRDGKNKAFVFCEGEKNIEELLKSGWVPSAAYARQDTLIKLKILLKNFNRSATPIHLLSSPVMNYLSDVDSPPGLIITSKRQIKSMGLKPSNVVPLLLILHKLQLPQNVGALCRTAEASGVTGVYLTKGTVDAYNPKVIRGSSGSVFRLPLIQGQEFDDIIVKLREQPISILAAHQNGSTDYTGIDWTKPTALLMGEEGGGFKSEELKKVTQTIRIPMAGEIESLNVGVAAAVCLFEAAKQRRVKGGA